MLAQSRSAQYPELPNLTHEDVLDSEVPGAKKSAVELRNPVRIRRTMEAVEIHHLDLSRLFNVRVGIDNRGRRDVIADIRKLLPKLQVPARLKMELLE